MAKKTKRLKQDEVIKKASSSSGEKRVLKKKKNKGEKLKKNPTKYKRGDLGKAIFALFDEVGVDKVTYKETFEVAKKAKPDTTYERGYFSWHKNKYRNDHDLSLKIAK